MPANRALADGLYVLASGSAASDASLVAGRCASAVRPAATPKSTRGAITHFVSAGNFRVRGETVDATGATLQNCPAAGLAAGLFVRIEGSVAGTGMRAAVVRCVR